jgi:hypothetical protein
MEVWPNIFFLDYREKKKELYHKRIQWEGAR